MLPGTIALDTCGLLSFFEIIFCAYVDHWFTLKKRNLEDVCMMYFSHWHCVLRQLTMNIVGTRKGELCYSSCMHEKSFLLSLRSFQWGVDRRKQLAAAAAKRCSRITSGFFQKWQGSNNNPTKIFKDVFSAKSKLGFLLIYCWNVKFPLRGDLDKKEVSWNYAIIITACQTWMLHRTDETHIFGNTDTRRSWGYKTKEGWQYKTTNFGAAFKLGHH